MKSLKTSKVNYKEIVISDKYRSKYQVSCFDTERQKTTYRNYFKTLAEAEECFKKVIPLDHKSYKTNALYSLGVLCYNDGANILKKATPLANSDADKYAAEKEKATARFKEA